MIEPSQQFWSPSLDSSSSVRRAVPGLVVDKLQVGIRVPFVFSGPLNHLPPITVPREQESFVDSNCSEGVCVGAGAARDREVDER